MTRCACMFHPPADVVHCSNICSPGLYGLAMKYGHDIKSQNRCRLCRATTVPVGRKGATTSARRPLLHTAGMLGTLVPWLPLGKTCMLPMPCTVKALQQPHRCLITALPSDLIACCLKLTNQSQPFSSLETSAAANNVSMCENSTVTLCCVHVSLLLRTSQVTCPDTFSLH